MPPSHPTDPYILLVEDEENDRALFRRAAARLGFPARIEEAGDGEEAIAFLHARLGEPHPETALPTLVVLDLKMPRLSGHEVLEWRRRQPGLRRVPFIVLTSSPESPDVEHATDLGANSYLVKPVAPPEYQDLVRAVTRYWLRFNATPARPEP